MASDAKQFLNMRTRKDVASFFGISLQQLCFLAFSRTPKYTTFYIGKKRLGERREIKAPIVALKQLQRKLASAIEEVYESNNPPDAVHGFRSHRSIATNARCHVRRAMVLNLDLKDFFPCINGGRIRGLFLADPFSFPEEVADVLTNLCCDSTGLPQGAPTSPILSNCICKRMDKQLLSFANAHNLVYSRYADDITFSAFNKRQLRHACLADDSASIHLSDQLRKIIEANGFQIHDAKTHLSTKSSRQEVTGVIVNEKCNYKRSDYRELRVLLNNWLVVGYEYAGEEYLKHKPDVAVAILDDRGEISEGKLKAHVRGRLAFYTMLINQNAGMSSSLRKLWTTYAEITHEKVPMVNPDSAVWQIVTCYDYKLDDNDSLRPFNEVGTVFKTRGGLLITAAHCIADHDEAKACSGACCDIEFGHTKQFCKIENFEWDLTYDYAVTRELPLPLQNTNGLTCDIAYKAQIGERVWAYGYSDARKQLRCLDAQVSEVYSEKMLIRVDRPFIQGMSGGPVFNSRGNVIGIVVHGSAPHEYAYDGEFLSIAAVHLNDL